MMIEKFEDPSSSSLDVVLRKKIWPKEDMVPRLWRQSHQRKMGGAGEECTRNDLYKGIWSKILQSSNPPILQIYEWLMIGCSFLFQCSIYALFIAFFLWKQRISRVATVDVSSSKYPDARTCDVLGCVMMNEEKDRMSDYNNTRSENLEFYLTKLLYCHL
jgi:hypothetical protein